MAACLMFNAEVNHRHHKSVRSAHVDKGATHDVGSGRNDPGSRPKSSMRARVGQVRARCGRHFRNGFEKLELTEHEVTERRHARAQRLIAKTLKRADRPRRRRVKISALCFRRLKMRVAWFSPLMSCIRWLPQPFLRWARMVALAASKVELRKHFSSRVTCLPLDDNLVPLILSVCE